MLCRMQLKASHTNPRAATVGGGGRGVQGLGFRVSGFMVHTCKY